MVKIQHGEERVTYGFNQQHVKLFCELQKESNVPNKRKNGRLKWLLALLGGFSVIYIFILKKRFNANIAEAHFKENINFIDYVVNVLLEPNRLKSYLQINGEYIIFMILMVIMFIIYVFLTKKNKLKIIDFLYSDNGEKNEIKEEIKKETSNQTRFKNIISIDLYLSKIYKKSLLNYEMRHRKQNQASSGEWYTYRDLKTKKEKIYGEDWVFIKIRRKFLIEISNWNNVIIATWIFMGAIIFNLIDVLNISGFIKKNALGTWLIYFKEILLMVVLSYLMVRIISRGIEIAVAFYKDVVEVNSKLRFFTDDKPKEKDFINKFNFSLLRTNARLSLAIHSLIEIVITFAVLYWLLLVLFSDQAQSITLVETLLFSFSVSAFNFSFMSYDLMLFTIFHVIQVLLSVVLILIALAQYLGGEKLTLEERDFYADIKVEEAKP